MGEVVECNKNNLIYKLNFCNLKIQKSSFVCKGRLSKHLSNDPHEYGLGWIGVEQNGVDNSLSFTPHFREVRTDRDKRRNKRERFWVDERVKAL